MPASPGESKEKNAPFRKETKNLIFSVLKTCLLKKSTDNHEATLNILVKTCPKGRKHIGGGEAIGVKLIRNV